MHNILTDYSTTEQRHTRKTTAILKVPDERASDRRQYYSNESRIIVLEGPRGYMLSLLLTPPPTATPSRFDYYTIFPENYSPYTESGVPATRPADVTAVSWAVAAVADNEYGPVVSTPVGFDTNTNTSAEDIVLSVLDPTGRVQGVESSGVRIGSNHTSISHGAGGLVVNESGVRVSEGFENPSTTAKGISKESSVFGLLPKTAVTFPAADYLPDINRLIKIGNFMLTITAILDAVVEFARLVRAPLAVLGADNPRPDGEDLLGTASEGDRPPAAQ